MVQVACGVCENGHGQTSLVMTSDGGSPSFKKSILDVLEDIDDAPKISFPIYGNKYMTRYLDSYTYVHLVESPGVVFLTPEVELASQAKAFADAVYASHSLVFLLLSMCFIVGFTMWVLEWRSNNEQFGANFFGGVSSGIWWAWMSMSTVGYGDKVARTITGRLLSVVWILIGLATLSLLTGCITAALNIVTHSDIKIYGSKVAAIHNSSEYRIGILMNAVVNQDQHYRSFQEVGQALIKREVEGALVDSYVAAEYQQELFTGGVRVNRLLKKSFGYGIVLSGAVATVKKSFDDYIAKNITQILRIIDRNTDTIPIPNKSLAEEKALKMFDISSAAYLDTLMASAVSLGIAVVFGLVWHYCILSPRQRANRNRKMTSLEEYKASLVKETRQMVEEFCDKTKNKLKTMKRRHALQRQQALAKLEITKSYNSTARRDSFEKSDLRTLFNRFLIRSPVDPERGKEFRNQPTGPASGL